MPPDLLLTLGVGALLGLLSGLSGTGCGSFLTPLLAAAAVVQVIAGRKLLLT